MLRAGAGATARGDDSRVALAQQLASPRSEAARVGPANTLTVGPEPLGRRAGRRLSDAGERGVDPGPAAGGGPEVVSKSSACGQDCRRRAPPATVWPGPRAGGPARAQTVDPGVDAAVEGPRRRDQQQPRPRAARAARRSSPRHRGQPAPRLSWALTSAPRAEAPSSSPRSPSPEAAPRGAARGGAAGGAAGEASGDRDPLLIRKRRAASASAGARKSPSARAARFCSGGPGARATRHACRRGRARG